MYKTDTIHADALVTLGIDQISRNIPSLASEELAC